MVKHIKKDMEAASFFQTINGAVWISKSDEEAKNPFINISSRLAIAKKEMEAFSENETWSIFGPRFVMSEQGRSEL